MAVVAPMAAISSRVLKEMPEKAVQSIFYRSTAAGDYLGGEGPGEARPFNYGALRESHRKGERSSKQRSSIARGERDDGAGDRGRSNRRRGAGSRLSATAPPLLLQQRVDSSCEVGGSSCSQLTASAVLHQTPAASQLSATLPAEIRSPQKKKWRLTTYEQDFLENSTEVAGIDASFREMNVAKGRAQIQNPDISYFTTSYEGFFSGQRRHSGNAPLRLEQDNRLRQLVGPGADTDSCPKKSFAQSQHLEPPKGAVRPPAVSRPMDQIGSVPKAADFFKSEARRNHSLSAVGQVAPKVLPRVASAPNGLGFSGGRTLQDMTEELGPERAFRQMLMNSEYGRSISTSRHPKPDRR